MGDFGDALSAWMGSVAAGGSTAGGGSASQLRSLLEVGAADPVLGAEADEVAARARAQPAELRATRSLLEGGLEAAVDDVEELYDAGLPRGLPGGLSVVAITHRGKLLRRVKAVRDLEAAGGGAGGAGPPAEAGGLRGEATASRRRRGRAGRARGRRRGRGVRRGRRGRRAVAAEKVAAAAEKEAAKEAAAAQRQAAMEAAAAEKEVAKAAKKAERAGRAGRAEAAAVAKATEKAEKEKAEPERATSKKRAASPALGAGARHCESAAHEVCAGEVQEGVIKYFTLQIRYSYSRPIPTATPLRATVL